MELFGEATAADPYRVFADLRQRDPVHRSAEVDAWVLTRFDDVRAVLHDTRFSSRVLDAGAPAGAGEAAGGTVAATRTSEVLAAAYTFVNHSLVFADAPQHTRLRRLVAHAFVPSAIAALRRPIEQHAQRLLDAVGPRFDVVPDVAAPLPIAVLGDLLGVSLVDEDGRRLKQACDEFLLPWGRDVSTLSPADRDRAEAAGQDLRSFVDAVLANAAPEPPHDGVVDRLVAGEASDHLSREELFATIVLLLIAGHENLTSLIGNGVDLLLDRPDVRARLREDPARWPAAIDELLRMITPNQFIRRVAHEDVRVGDVSIPAGATVVLVLAAANRDPDRFPDPDTFVLDRPDHRDVALGQGPHYCLGGPLARLEAELVLSMLFERHPSLSRVGPPRYGSNLNLRLIQSLPVTTSPT